MLGHDWKPNQMLELVEQFGFVRQIRLQTLAIQLRVDPAHHRVVEVLLLDEQLVALQQSDEAALADLQELLRLEGQVCVQIDDADQLADFLLRNRRDLPVLVENDGRVVDRQFAVRVLHQGAADIVLCVVLGSRVGRVQVRQFEFAGVNESGRWQEND